MYICIIRFLSTVPEIKTETLFHLFKYILQFKIIPNSNFLSEQEST